MYARTYALWRTRLNGSWLARRSERIAVGVIGQRHERLKVERNAGLSDRGNGRTMD
jgi:hypothetical protein